MKYTCIIKDVGSDDDADGHDQNLYIYISKRMIR